MSIERYRVGNRPAQAQACARRRVRSGVDAVMCRHCGGDFGVPNLAAIFAGTEGSAVADRGRQWPQLPVSGVRTKGGLPC
jgi:hypothetical protein